VSVFVFVLFCLDILSFPYLVIVSSSFPFSIPFSVFPMIGATGWAAVVIGIN